MHHRFTRTFATILMALVMLVTALGTIATPAQAALVPHVHIVFTFYVDDDSLPVDPGLEVE